MIKFTTPESLSGKQLIDELVAAGVTITEPPLLDGNRELWLDIEAAYKDKATAVVNAHVGIDYVPTLTIEQKLASVGLSISDLKTALGI